MGKYYTVYLSSTDEIAASGSATECAAALNMTKDSFRCAVSRYKNGKRKKYIIIEENESDMK